MSSLDDQRVVVGMSGGVDSSVAALRLKAKGYDVHGLFMTNWEEDEEGYCQAAEDLQEARRIAGQLDIPLHHVNFAREYRERVFQYFLDEYAAGRTPNPDVLCNREIKFGVFFDYADRLGAAYVATGHYARVAHGAGPSRLLEAVDPAKDQTYFLHAISQARLARTLFPVGDLAKSEVRAIAAREGFANHDRKDSTGICFIGERHFKTFLQQYLPASPGDIETPDGQHLGRHEGLMYYTLGQRQGLGIGGRADARSEPWYVATKDLARNVLVVVQGHDHPLLRSEALVGGAVHWLADEAPRLPMRCLARTRYRQSLQECTVKPSGERVSVRFDTPQRAVTPGQYVVFHRDGECLGGAVIERACARAADLPSRTPGASEATAA